MSQPLPPPPPPDDPTASGLPWEARENRSPVEAFVETLKMVAMAPVEAFARARRSGELVSPLAYAVIIAWIGVLAERIWSLVIGTSILSMLPSEGRDSAAMGFALSGLGLAAALILAPIFILIALFVWAGIVHLFLMLYGGTRESPCGFEGTLRVLAWSSTSQLGQLVPLAGGLIVMIWSIVLQTVGLAAFHRTSQGKAVAAVLTPLLLCCVCVGFFFAGVLAMIFGAAAQAGR